jgi:serine/threonine-protein phosphatase 2A catalytic subunit
MCDLMWSNLVPIDGFKPSIRNAGFQFGGDVSKSFNEANGLKLTARAHQLVMNGVNILIRKILLQCSVLLIIA